MRRHAAVSRGLAIDPPFGTRMPGNAVTVAALDPGSAPCAKAPLSVHGVRTGPLDGARVRAAAALRSVSATYDSLFAKSSLAALMLDAQGLVVHANRALLDATGWTTDEVIGTSWFDRFVEPPRDDHKKAFLRVLAGDPAVEVYTIDVLTRSGGRVRMRWQNALVRADDRAVGTASVGEIIPIVSNAGATNASSNPLDQGSHEIIALARALIHDPRGSALPFVRMVAEHCAQLAEEGGERMSGPAAADRIRRQFRLHKPG